MDQMIKVLLVDDDEEEYLIVKKVFKSIDQVKYHLTCVFDFQQGLHEVLSGDYDVGLIDYRLGTENGLELVHAAIKKGCEIPLILLTGYGDHDIDVKAMQAGVVDYLNKKEINGQILERVIRYAIERKKTENQLKKLNKQYQFLAENDLLTGVSNRNQFNVMLPVITERCVRNKNNLAVMFFDLDQFKQVNDTLGHSYGDILLKQVPKRLKKIIRKIDYFFRLGGDEFVLVVEGKINEENIRELAHRALKALSEPFWLNEYECKISASIGITVANWETMRSPEQLLKEADIAMYSAKKHGRNNFQFYQPEYVEDFLRYSHLTIDLQNALNNEELTLHYQPLIDISTNKIIGVEALLRWNHPVFGNIPPKVFIPIAEKTGLIITIGEWVLKTACIQHKQWREAGFHSTRMAINISIYQFQHVDFIDLIQELINKMFVNPNLLELEISESVVLTTNFKECANKMKILKRLGIHLVIDDFGTGYSNLGYLKHFPFDKIKIDKIFIDEISSSNNEQCIVEAIINMAKKLGLYVLAEGVETIAQLNYLKQHHSDQVQGFYFSKPVTAEACTKLLKKGIIVKKSFK